jgi:hypothetical protein
MKIDKISLCEDMLLSSARFYKNGICDVDFATSILLSGAVNEITEPLLKELGIKTRRGCFSELAAKLSKSEKSLEDKEKIHFGLSKSVYNSIKHAGSGERGKKIINASEDLEIFANLKGEASWSLSFALENFLALPEPYVTQQRINHVYSDEFLDLFQTLRYEIG